MPTTEIAPEIEEATAAYERWLRRFMRPVAADLAEKHRRMASGLFPFLRATFYRWCQLWQTLAPDERATTPVLALGDLHLENFGTWRDGDGRLIWGTNDFDEATRLPWSHDLVRLATSAHVAIESHTLRLRRRDACAALLDGYREGLEAGGRPFVLEEDHAWLRRVAMGDLRDPPTFWKRMDALETVTTLDRGARAALMAALPAGSTELRFATRVAGLGSLGRPRFVAMASWSGGKVAREVKALTPSAWRWATGSQATGSDYARLLGAAIRAPDPTVGVRGGWILRRLAPHCTRIDLGDLPAQRDEERLVRAMGFETANVHLGTPGARAGVLRQLRRRKERWLNDQARGFAEALTRDWERWRQLG